MPTAVMVLYGAAMYLFGITIITTIIMTMIMINWPRRADRDEPQRRFHGTTTTETATSTRG